MGKSTTHCVNVWLNFTFCQHFKIEVAIQGPRHGYYWVYSVKHTCTLYTIKSRAFVFNWLKRQGNSLEPSRKCCHFANSSSLFPTSSQNFKESKSWFDFVATDNHIQDCTNNKPSVNQSIAISMTLLQLWKCKQSIKHLWYKMKVIFEFICNFLSKLPNNRGFSKLLYLFVKPDMFLLKLVCQKLWLILDIKFRVLTILSTLNNRVSF